MSGSYRVLLGLVLVGGLWTVVGCGEPVRHDASTDRHRSLWASDDASDIAMDAASQETLGLGDGETANGPTSLEPRRPVSAAPSASVPKAKPLGTLSFDPRNAPPKPKPPPPMLSVQLQHGRIEGLPIGLFSDTTLLMRTNGSIEFIEKQKIVSHRVTNQPFTSQDARALSAELQTEFGNNYHIRNAQPYLVIAKPDRIGLWCERFQRFHRSIQLFCTTNKVPIRALEFPLVAVVFGSKREFEEYAKVEKSKLPLNCVGYYSQRTNRIVLYETGTQDAQETQATLETICHEATHQYSFNSGLTQRLSETPLWLTEGFAVQFEAPAYCNYASRDQTSYWPPSQRHQWLELKKDRPKLQRLIQALIESDKPFETDTLNAYTASWALNSYLCQRARAQYGQYIRRISSLQPFQDYPQSERLRDFSIAFGTDIPILIRETILHIDHLP